MNRKGFIQIPILITIIVGFLVLGGGGYLGVKQYQNYQIQKAEKDKLTQETAKLQAEKDQQKTEEQSKQNAEIEKLKKDIQALKSSNAGTVDKESSNEINSGELQPYLDTMVQVECKNARGTGTLWNSGGQYSVLTNYHVVETPFPDGHCNVRFTDDAS